MRVILALVMGAMLAVVTTTDRVLCIDGCTDDLQHDGLGTATPSVCSLCHGWNGPVVISVGGPAPLPIGPRVRTASRELPAHAAPLYHPPKLA
ncbi:MAG: hypothetical protein AB7O28_07295 [Vicinamibacterales bacterium]